MASTSISLNDLTEEQLFDLQTNLDLIDKLSEIGPEQKVILASIGETVRRRGEPEEVNTEHIRFSSVTDDHLKQIGIELPTEGSLVELVEDGNYEFSTQSDIFLATTLIMTEVYRRFVGRTEMASRFLIDLVLLLALGSMDFTDPTGSLVYYPWLYHEYNVRKISFPVLGTTKTYSFAGRVDYLIILLELPNSRLVAPHQAIQNQRRLLTKNPRKVLLENSEQKVPVMLVEANSKEDFDSGDSGHFKHHAQVGIEAAAICKAHGLSVVRGCLSDGTRWVFFAYMRGMKGQAAAGTLVATQTFVINPEEMGGSTARIAKLLYRWVQYSLNDEIKFSE